MKWKKWHSVIIIFFLIFSALPREVIAQADAKVRFLVQPGDSFRVKVDNDSIYAESKLTLPEGEHNFKIWAPNHGIVDTTIILSREALKTIILYLHHPDEWYTWRKQKRRTEFKKNLVKAGPNLLSAALVLASAYNFLEYRSGHLRIQEIQEDYNSEFSSVKIYNLKSEFDDELNSMLEHRSKMRLYMGASIVSIVVAYLISKKVNKRKFPQYLDQQKIKFEGLSFYNDYNSPFLSSGFNLTIGF